MNSSVSVFNLSGVFFKAGGSYVRKPDGSLGCSIIGTHPLVQIALLRNWNAWFGWHLGYEQRDLSGFQIEPETPLTWCGRLSRVHVMSVQPRNCCPCGCVMPPLRASYREVVVGEGVNLHRTSVSLDKGLAQKKDTGSVSWNYIDMDPDHGGAKTLREILSCQASLGNTHLLAGVELLWAAAFMPAWLAHPDFNNRKVIIPGIRLCDMENGELVLQDQCMTMFCDESGTLHFGKCNFDDPLDSLKGPDDLRLPCVPLLVQ